MKKNLTRSATCIAILLILSKLLGFLREILLADRFGTSYIADAYAVSTTLPAVLFTLVSKGFSESYIPIHARLIPEKQGRLFSNTVTLMTLFSTFVAVVAALLAPQITGILAPGYEGIVAQLTAQYCRIMVFQLPILVCFALLSARLQAQEDFIPGSFCDFIIVNVILILSIYLATPEHPMMLAYGYIISMGVALAALWLYARCKHGLRVRPVVDPKDSDFRSLCALAIPLGLSLLVDQLNGMVDRMFASGLGEGVTSALSYANRVQSILLTLTTTIFIQVCYPRMNRHFAAGQREEGSGYVQKAILIACYTSIPLVVMFVLYASPVVSVIFQRGAFSDDSTAITAACLSLYALGIPFFAFRTILTNTLAANTKQKLILRNTVITVAANILFNVLMVRYWGYRGLALATSLSGVLAAGLMFFDVRRLKLPVFTRHQALDVAKYIVGTGLAAAVSVPVNRCLQDSVGTNWAAMAAIAAAALVYIVVTVLLKPELLVWLYTHLPKKMQILRGFYPVSGGKDNE